MARHINSNFLSQVFKEEHEKQTELILQQLKPPTNEPSGPSPDQITQLSEEIEVCICMFIHRSPGLFARLFARLGLCFSTTTVPSVTAASEYTLRHLVCQI